jgi:hypothetical protein
MSLRSRKLGLCSTLYDRQFAHALQKMVALRRQEDMFLLCLLQTVKRLRFHLATSDEV